MNAAQSRARNLLILAVKVTVAVLLIGWLVRSGALDFSKLLVLVRRPSLLALNMATWCVGLLVGAVRWRMLLRLAGVSVPFSRVAQLQLTGQFFNVVVPGNVGGDVVKALYVARDAEASKRTTILLVGFVDRLVGLAGLITMATIVTVARAPVLWSDPLVRPLATTVCVLGAGMWIGVTGFVLFMRWGGERVEAWTTGPSRVSKILSQLVGAIRLLTSSPKVLVLTLGLSGIAHACSMALFTVLTPALTGQDVPYASVATIFPLGILTLMLPISPVGLGVGHVAFDRLFATIGLTGGANVFNVWLLGQIAMSLFGVFPYLPLRRSRDP